MPIMRLEVVAPPSTGIPPMWLLLALIGVLAAAFVVIVLLSGGSRRSSHHGIVQRNASESASAYRGYALALIDAGRMADALTAARAHLSHVPTDVRMRAVLAVLCASRGDAEQASTEFERAIRTAQRTWENHPPHLAPYMACLLLGYAATLRTRGNTEEADNRRREALRLDPELAQVREGDSGALLLTHARDDELERRAFEDLAHWERGRALAVPFGLAEGSDAVTFYQTAVAANPTSAALHADLADAWHSIGDHARAEREFQEALRLDGRDAWIRFRHGLMLWRRELVAEAERELHEAAQIAPKRAAVRGTLGVFYMRQSQFAKAEQELLAAINARPDIWALARLYGTVALRQGKLDRAARAFEEAERLGANDTHFRMTYADIRAQLGQPHAADEQYRLALRRHPTSGALRAGYGGFLLRQGRLRDAEQELRQAVLLPDADEAYLHLVRLLLLQRRLDEVIPYMEAGLQRDPSSNALKEAQAEWMLLRGRPAEAEGLTLQVMRAGSQTGTLQLVRGNALLALGRDLEAQAALREAVRLDPSLPERVYAQARALRELGRAGAAYDLLGQVVLLRPDWREAVDARELLAAEATATRRAPRGRPASPKRG